MFSFSSFAFETKSEAFNSREWRNLCPVYKQHIDKDCESKNYLISETMPVHEKITFDATNEFCSNHKNTGIFYLECLSLSKGWDGGISSNDSLFSGVLFNDDPQGLVRRDRYGIGAVIDWLGALIFNNYINEKDTLTYKTHNGERQFLHSMRSCSNEEGNQTVEKITTYIADNFNLAKNINKAILNNDYDSLNKIFINSEESPKLENKNERIFYSYLDLFFPYGDDSEDEFASKSYIEKVKTRSRALALLSLGSALHVIQDSYSKSHTNRDEYNKRIINFYYYPNREHELSDAKHCEYDQYAIQNKDAIQTAIRKSTDFLNKFVESNCNPEDSNNTCKEEIKTWLKANVFDLAEQPRK